MFGLFVPSSDSYMVIHDNLYSELTISKDKHKKMECYEPVHQHVSYFNVTERVTPSHHLPHHPAPHIIVTATHLMTGHPLGVTTGARLLT